jgi:hypothetical protein
VAIALSLTLSLQLGGVARGAAARAGRRLMRLGQPDTNPGAYVVDFTCIRCGKRRRRAAMRADLDGPAFAYFCDPGCLPATPAEAIEIYAHAGCTAPGGRWKR